MTYPLNKKRLIKIIGLCTLAVWLIVLTSLIFKSLNVSSQLMQSETTRTLENKVAVIEMKLVELSEQQASVTDPWVKQTQLVAVQEELRARIQTLSEHLTGFVKSGEFNTLQIQVQQLEKIIDTLKTTLQQKSVPTEVKPVVSTSSKVPVQSNARTNTPFKVLGVELRGGQATLVIIANKAGIQKNIEAVELLQIGDNFANWQLTAINDRIAVFKVGSQTRRMTIPNQRTTP